MIASSEYTSARILNCLFCNKPGKNGKGKMSINVIRLLTVGWHLKICQITLYTEHY